MSAWRRVRQVGRRALRVFVREVAIQVLVGTLIGLLVARLGSGAR